MHVMVVEKGLRLGRVPANVSSRNSRLVHRTEQLEACRAVPAPAYEQDLHEVLDSDLTKREDNLLRCMFWRKPSLAHGADRALYARPHLEEPNIPGDEVSLLVG